MITGRITRDLFHVLLPTLQPKTSLLLVDGFWHSTSQHTYVPGPQNVAVSVSYADDISVFLWKKLVDVRST
jgi:hypothetical protein